MMDLISNRTLTDIIMIGVIWFSAGLSVMAFIDWRISRDKKD